MRMYTLIKFLPQNNLIRAYSQQSTFEKSCHVIRTISQEDVCNFSKVTGDTNPVHFEGDAPIVHGALLLGIVSGIIGTRHVTAN